MSNVMTTTTSMSTRRVAPEASWVTVRDERGRPHLEQRWVCPGASLSAAHHATDLHHAA